ncbi:hypothetical protein GCM10007420_22760 [Glycocaulis albus]|uniref:Uncharacterized protein n=1 Tax=Glycocaulis albus TaxID=1382801 RepID=A0ABQ1XWR3_9PROT|nr:hypothetical protein [Glycocaulis albus]GGH05724.1 hypothetical protein GCM10007420_22760 [Glycocaulis albus]
MSAVALACEGPYDLVAMRSLICELASGVVSFREVFPAADATGSEGGWAKLIERLKRLFNGDANVFFEMPLFDGDDAISHLIIHFDADIAEEAANYQGIKFKKANTELERIELIILMIQSIIDDSGEDFDISKIIYAIPSPCTEGWLLLSCSPENYTPLMPSKDAKSALKRIHPGCLNTTKKYDQACKEIWKGAEKNKGKSVGLQRFTINVEESGF